MVVALNIHIVINRYLLEDPHLGATGIVTSKICE